MIIVCRFVLVKNCSIEVGRNCRFLFCIRINGYRNRRLINYPNTACIYKLLLLRAAFVSLVVAVFISCRSCRPPCHRKHQMILLSYHGHLWVPIEWIEQGVEMVC